MTSTGWNSANDNSPSPYFPALSADFSVAAASHTGGWGSWKGLGVCMRSGKVIIGLSQLNRSCSHIRTTISVASCHCWRERSSIGTPNAIRSMGVERPVPHSTRPWLRDVDGRHLFGHPGRVLEPRRHQDDAEAEPDVLRACGQAAEHDLRRRAGRTAVAESGVRHTRRSDTPACRPALSARPPRRTPTVPRPAGRTGAAASKASAWVETRTTGLVSGPPLFHM